jgi:oligopeptide transport system permease protein
VNVTAVPAAFAGQEWEVGKHVGLWRDAWQRFRRNRLAVAGLAFVAGLCLLALSAPLLTALHILADPYQQDVTKSYQGLSPAHPFGLDVLGRDVLSRVIHGAQISLAVGIGVQFIVLIIGTTVGLIAGYAGGRTDNLLMRFTDIMFSFPDLLFVLIIVASFGPTFINIFLAIGVVYWTTLARLVRGQVLAIKETEFIEAARASAARPLRIVFRHLLPNTLGPIIVTLTFGVPQAIFTEAVLSFLGIGVRPPTPDWGVMVNEGYSAIFSYPYLVLFPSLAIGLTTLAFTFVGDGLRDALDPRMRR